MKKLPVGIQDFRTLREGQYLYVDKTEIICKIPQVGKYIFLSRPRRFGKSLLLSTLKEMYLGSKELFLGLWAENNWDWNVYPVIYIDLNMVDTRKSDLENGLMSQIFETAIHYNIQLERKTSKDCFAELLVKLSDLGKKVVVLIDEYVKPITDYLNISEKREEHVKLLKGFYGTIKSYDNCIQQTVLSGVSKYGKVSIFSDLNNLLDISTHRDFNNLCKYTQNELEFYFEEQVNKLGILLELPKAELYQKIKLWYNGYSWDGKNTLYNPFSVLSLFAKEDFDNYWFETGTPSFLMEMVKQMQVMPQELNGIEGDDIVLESADVNNIGIISLLYQTGYLTIKEKHRGGMRPTSYTLGFPNEEVRLSFQRYLLAEYLSIPPDMASVNYTTKLRKNMESGNWEAFFEIVGTRQLLVYIL